MGSEIRRMEYEGDPERCQARSAMTGQCQLKAMEGTSLCIRHGGVQLTNNIEKSELHIYQVRKYKNRIKELKTNPESNNLHEELAVLRMILEDCLIKAAKEDGDAAEGEGMGLLLYSTKINELIKSIKDVILAVDKLNMRSRNYIGREDVIQMTAQIINSISLHVKDEETLLSITNDLERVLTDGQNL
jgi:hypothetical protein